MSNLKQIKTLVKNDFNFMFGKKSAILSFGILITIILIITILGKVQINNKFNSELDKLEIINIYIIINSVIFVILGIITTLTLFMTQIKNNVHTVELRFGYKISNLYLAKIIVDLLINYVIFMVLFIFSLILFATEGNSDALLTHRMFIIPYCWYGVIILITIAVCLIFSLYLSELMASILSPLVLILILLLPAITSIASSMTMPDPLKGSTYNFIVANKYRMDAYNNIIELDKGEELLQDFENIQNEEQWETLFIDGPLLVDNLATKYPTYYSYISTFQNVLSGISDNSISWGEIEVFQINNPLAQDPLQEVISEYQALSNDASYNNLLNGMNNYAKNLVWFEQLDITNAVEVPPLENFQKNQIRITYKDPFSYLFFKAFDIYLKLASEYSYRPLESRSDEIIPLVDEKYLKQDKINNFLNPLSHINLMFLGNYHASPQLYNLVNQNSFISKASPNIGYKAESNLGLEGNYKLSSLTPPFLIYLFYTIIMVLIYIASYFKFKKKIRS